MKIKEVNTNYPEKIMPRFELSCYRILEED